MEFKAENLPGNCPPNDGVKSPLNNIYRLVKDIDNISETDFLTHVESKQRFPPSLECEANALSFFTTEKAADNIRKRVKKFKGYSIVCGNIEDDKGIHTNKNKHINFWLAKDTNIYEEFCNIQRSDNE